MTERYATGWSDPRAIYTSDYRVWLKYGEEYDTDEWTIKNIWKKPMKRKVDAHEYKTEAKDLPIDACKSMWIINYGDAPVPAIKTAEQEPLMWEIGNRLWWANELEYNQNEDTYTCKL